MEILVGYTGFVGSNIKKNWEFDKYFNSKNIEEAFGLEPNLCVYSAVPSEMYTANNNPNEDLRIVKEAIQIIQKINPKKLVLISTVAVYDTCDNVNEDHYIDDNKVSIYGKNRLLLEKWVETNMDSYHIIRLPALFGINLKKNFIYDYINIVPRKLNPKKYKEIIDKFNLVKDYYTMGDSLYECKNLNKLEKEKLKNIFEEYGFTALNFTDSRSIYQFYNLDNLSKHIKIIIKHNLAKVNLVTEPISIHDLYMYLKSKEFNNYVLEKPFFYNLKSKYAHLFNGNNGYLMNKKEIVDEIKNFINNYEDVENENINI